MKKFTKSVSDYAIVSANNAKFVNAVMEAAKENSVLVMLDTRYENGQDGPMYLASAIEFQLKKHFKLANYEVCHNTIRFSINTKPSVTIGPNL